MKEYEINILVSQHNDSYVPNLKIIKPITCGNYKDSNKLSDSTGINISSLNKKYCELTAQYWAWKNLNSDYYGFFHYRRYLSFNEKTELEPQNYECIDKYFIENACLNDDTIKKIVSNYDIIVPTPLKFAEDIYNQYKNSQNHNIKDLDDIIDILLKKFPEYEESINYIKKTKNFYCGNIYIMKKELFFNYCSWLFPLLEEFDKNHNYEKSNMNSLRVVGFLAERLFNIYFDFLKRKNKKLKIKTLPFCWIRDTSNPYPIKKQRESIPVVLACDNKYAKYAGLVIEEIMTNNKSNSFYEIFIMTYGVSKFWNEKLIEITNKYKNLKITIVRGERWISNRDLNEINHVNKTTFLRLGILDYLRNYDKVIYLDCDITVNDDLNNLYKININDFALGACLDTIQISYLSNEKSEASILFKKYGIKNSWNYFNAGVLLMNIKKMNEISSWNNLISLCEKNKYKFQDQDVLNIMYQGHVKILDNKWNCFSHNRITYPEIPEKNAPEEVYSNYIKAYKNPSIIHYASRTIPSFCGDSSLSEYFWKYVENSSFHYEILRDMVTINFSFSKNKHERKIRTIIINLIKKNKLIYRFCLSAYKHIFRK